MARRSGNLPVPFHGLVAWVYDAHACARAALAQVQCKPYTAAEVEIDEFQFIYSATEPPHIKVLNEMRVC